MGSLGTTPQSAYAFPGTRHGASAISEHGRGRGWVCFRGTGAAAAPPGGPPRPPAAPRRRRWRPPGGGGARGGGPPAPTGAAVSGARAPGVVAWGVPAPRRAFSDAEARPAGPRPRITLTPPARLGAGGGQWLGLAPRSEERAEGW